MPKNVQKLKRKLPERKIVSQITPKENKFFEKITKTSISLIIENGKKVVKDKF